jgi:hypothetical protein
MRSPLSLALTLTLALAVAPTLGAAQLPNGMEGEAIVGLAGQNDRQLFEKLRISPIGLNIGFIVQPLFGRRNISLAEQLSFYPVIFYERADPLLGGGDPPRSNPLIINTLMLRLGTDEPEAENRNVFFAGAGIGFAFTTPREGDKVSPMFGVGMRRWFPRQLGFEISLQCAVLQIGRTACQLPISSLWPFGNSPGS